MKTYEETIEYLNTFKNFELSGFDSFKKSVSLDKIRNALIKLSNPHLSYKTIHVAGTKGKGSISVFISSILEESGYSVGLFTSPHLVSPRERIKINNKTIEPEKVIHLIEYLKKILGEDINKQFTFFEIYTLLSMVYFQEEEVDFAVFEVGMGGRLDATNVIKPKVCAISPISYDHTNVLGETIKEIAGEKAAVIKNRIKCISSAQSKEAMGVIYKRCTSQTADLKIVGKDITFDIKKTDSRGSLFDIYSGNNIYKGCKTNMLGSYQISNCASAVGMYEALFDDKNIDKNAVKRGLEKAFIPGRTEVLCEEPLLVIDGAQNIDSAKKLKYSVEQIFKYDKLILLLGVSKDKDIAGICKELVPIADEIIITKADNGRALKPELIRGYIKGKKVHIANDTKEALGLSFMRAEQKDLILATGSFFLIGEIRKEVLKDFYKNNKLL